MARRLAKWMIEADAREQAGIEDARREQHLEGLGFSPLFARNSVHLEVPPFERVVAMIARGCPVEVIETQFADCLE